MTVTWDQKESKLNVLLLASFVCCSHDEDVWTLHRVIATVKEKYLGEKNKTKTIQIVSAEVILKAYITIKDFIS